MPQPDTVRSKLYLLIFMTEELGKTKKIISFNGRTIRDFFLSCSRGEVNGLNDMAIRKVTFFRGFP